MDSDDKGRYLQKQVEELRLDDKQDSYDKGKKKKKN